MPKGRFLLWAAQWLERKGLAGVAAVLENKAADSGSEAALHAAAKRALLNGDHTRALSCIDRALVHSPKDATLWCTRGAIQRHALVFDEALANYRQALAIQPKYVQALNNIGEWHLARGDTAEALSWLDKTLETAPDFFEGRVNHVAALLESDRYDEARKEAEALVVAEPGRPEPYVNLGNLLVHTGKAKQAVKLYRKALELRPDYAEAHFNLATLLGSQDDLKQAIAYLERQIKERGESAQRLGMLAAAHQAAGNLSTSETLCRKVIERHPDNLSAHVTLASCLSTGGDAAAALPVYRKVVELDPGQAAMASNVVFELNYLPHPREEIFSQHLVWAGKYEKTTDSPRAHGEIDRDPRRKLNIGYVSGDFCAHPVGFLLRDILRRHDRSQFEIHCFSMLLRPDEVSKQIEAAADHWQEAFLQSDDDFADMIVSAGIDILIDLSGHTAFHRLPAFSRRLAPVQATWIGYFHSTGMASMDYFITDPHTSPCDSGQLFSETPVYLPHTRFCYLAPDYCPDVAPSPALEKGYVTFGSFNRLAKMNNEVLETWVRILAAVPDSRLVLKAGAFKDDVIRERCIARFDALGIAATRLELRPASPHREMFAEYGDIDLALDPFPFNGGMTTLEALWMGVPVLTLEGDTVVSRQSYSALANLGIAAELSCRTVDDYLQKAVALARDVHTLQQLRAGIRPRMQASQICDADRFTHDLESLFRAMWQANCRGEKLPEFFAPDRIN